MSRPCLHQIGVCHALPIVQALLKTVLIGPSLTKIIPGENALHRVVSCVPGCCSTSLKTGGAQVVVIAHQTFVATPAKVSLQTRITADPCEEENIH